MSPLNILSPEADLPGAQKPEATRHVLIDAIRAGCGGNADRIRELLNLPSGGDLDEQLASVSYESLSQAAVTATTGPERSDDVIS